MEVKQTAVEWLWKSLIDSGFKDIENVEGFYYKAKEMENEFLEKLKDFDNWREWKNFSMKTKETKFGTYMEKETPTSLTSKKITIFVERLKKIGIDVKLSGNFPWVYIDEICGIRVTETFEANHGFTLIFLPGRNDSPVSEFTDIEEIFKLIRKYVKEAKFRQIEKLKAQIEILNEIRGGFNTDNRFYIDDKIEQLEQQLKEIRK